MPFLEPHTPTLESYWRSVILFGQNVASYKFALGQSLLELARVKREFVPLADLAVPFARHLTTHLKAVDKQGTSGQSQFLDVCRRFNAGEVGEDELVSNTVRRGFVNVLDAFHVVGGEDLKKRFFVDERKHSSPGIRLTQEIHRLAAGYQAQNLPGEIEARWRLVETAWSLDLSRNLLVVRYDPATGALVVDRAKVRRVSVTSCRSALDGYQKGKCFYCFSNISIVDGSSDLADVDHVFPHMLQARGLRQDLNGIWNLVLACTRCNRGSGGKFDAVPEDRYLHRLHRRNEFLIGSHHPLRETLLAQSGADLEARRQFLQLARNTAIDCGVGRWNPRDELEECF